MKKVLSPWILLWLLGCFGLFIGCGGEKRGKVGAFCNNDSECELGLCYEQRCVDPDGDEDEDGLKNGVEIHMLHTNPNKKDSDDDGIDDLVEVGDIRAALDSDGDAKPDPTLIDANESLLPKDDPDHDCLPDQFDPHNNEPDVVTEAQLLAACQRPGVCKEAASEIKATCEGGTLSCDYSAVPGYEENESSCDGKDNDCNGKIDEGCPGCSCEGKECGEDGCGNLCGLCPPEEECIYGLCRKPGEVTGNPGADKILLEPSVQQAVDESGFPINPGSNPPNIEGSYYPVVGSIVKTKNGRPVGSVINSPGTCFFGQTADGRLQLIEYGIVQAKGTFITGSGSKFTVYLAGSYGEILGSNEHVHILFSGEKTAKGLKNVHGLVSYKVEALQQAGMLPPSITEMWEYSITDWTWEAATCRTSFSSSNDCNLACAKLISCIEQLCAANPGEGCDEQPSQAECVMACNADANPGCTEKHCQVDENDPWKWNNQCLLQVDCDHLGECE